MPIEPDRAPRAFLFDLDGTLVDTVGTRVEAWLETFARYGIPAERDLLAPLMGSDGRLLARTVAEHHGVPLAAGVDARIDRAAGERFGQLNAHPRPLSGATELLEWLTDAGFPWAIATSSRPDEVVASVRALGLRSRPIVSDGDAVEHAKPAPDLLLKAAGLMGADPVDTWYVGDSRWDMMAAVAAGMVAVGIPTGATSETDLLGSGATLTFSDLGRLHAAISSAGPLVRPERGAMD
jgi:phosphoglycolate phosphatase-like HAD superfamily hydrolase